MSCEHSVVAHCCMLDIKFGIMCVVSVQKLPAPVPNCSSCGNLGAALAWTCMCGYANTKEEQGPAAMVPMLHWCMTTHVLHDKLACLLHNAVQGSRPRRRGQPQLLPQAHQKPRAQPQGAQVACWHHANDFSYDVCLVWHTFKGRPSLRWPKLRQVKRLCAVCDQRVA